jgi:hypothetical protein
MKKQTVIASVSSPSSKAVVASYSCDYCGNTQTVTAGLKTSSCVECGNSALTYVAKSKKTVTLANPVGLSCGKCGVINTVESKVALANAGQTHCVCCGSEINYDVDAIEESDEDDIDMTVTDILEDDEDEDINLDVVSAEDEDEDEDEESEEEKPKKGAKKAPAKADKKAAPAKSKKKSKDEDDDDDFDLDDDDE